MANVKITDLAAYTNPDSTDVLPIVDVGADVTKKVSIADLLENAGSGTASAPGIAFDGDSNTGIYRPGPDQLALATSGTERVEFGTSEVVFNDGGANYDFRIEGDTEANLFFVDASTDRVGVGTSSPGVALHVDGDIRCDGVYGETDTNTSIQFPGSDVITFNEGGAEAARIDDSGRLLVGTSNARSGFGSIQLEGTSYNSISCVNNTNDTGSSSLIFGKSRGTAVGSNTIVQSGDVLGSILFQGADGTAMATRAAAIFGVVDGTPGANDMPGRLVFFVTAGGSASPTEAMRIKNTRVINFSNAPVYADNAAAKTGGLVDGDVYRTSTGDLKIVYT